jgi:hypothetical protein
MVHCWQMVSRWYGVLEAWVALLHFSVNIDVGATSYWGSSLPVILVFSGFVAPLLLVIYEQLRLLSLDYFFFWNWASGLCGPVHHNCEFLSLQNFSWGSSSSTSSTISLPPSSTIWSGIVEDWVFFRIRNILVVLTRKMDAIIPYAPWGLWKLFLLCAHILGHSLISISSSSLVGGWQYGSVRYSGWY